jgi:hypothetical protein
MGFNHTDLTSHKFADSRQNFTARDNILYALGLGVGSEPTNAGHLQFVYEKGLRTLPTIGVVLAHPGFWAGIPELGIDWRHRPLAYRRCHRSRRRQRCYLIL